jgi:hypothetical protein
VITEKVCTHTYSMISVGYTNSMERLKDRNGSSLTMTILPFL